MTQLTQLSQLLTLSTLLEAIMIGWTIVIVVISIISLK